MVQTCSCGYFFYPLPAGAEYCSYMRHPAWGELPALPLPAYLANSRPPHRPWVASHRFTRDCLPRSLLPPPLPETEDPPASLHHPMPAALQVRGHAGLFGLPGASTQGCDGAVSPRESSYKLSAGTSRWPSSTSAVSPQSGGEGWTSREIMGREPSRDWPLSLQSCPHTTLQCQGPGEAAATASFVCAGLGPGCAG